MCFFLRVLRETWKSPFLPRKTCPEPPTEMPFPYVLPFKILFLLFSLLPLRLLDVKMEFLLFPFSLSIIYLDSLTTPHLFTSLFNFHSFSHCPFPLPEHLFFIRIQFIRTPDSDLPQNLRTNYEQVQPLIWGIFCYSWKKEKK